MEEKTRCIVLRTVKYGDNKIIVDLLTREVGRQSVVVKTTVSQRKSAGTTGRMSRQFFQPLTILEADISHTPRQKTAQLKEVRLATIYSTLPYDPIKLSLAFFVAEFLAMSTRDMHTDEQLYDFVENSLVWLDNTDRGIANFHLMFMMRMSRFLGFYPDIETYEEGTLFDLREGIFSHFTPIHRDFLNAADAKKMQTLMRMSPSNLHLFNMSRAERNRIIDISLQFYRIHIPAFREMKSLEVLREL